MATNFHDDLTFKKSVTFEGGATIGDFDLETTAQITTSTEVGKWDILTSRPWFPSPSSTPVLKDSWRGGFFFTPVPLPASELALHVTVAATGGTAAGRVALYMRNADGSPGSLVVDWGTVYGTIDLTSTGRRSVATPGLVIPAGHYVLGVAWTGTASTSPTLSAIGGGTTQRAMLDETVASAVSSGWSMAASGGSAPGTFVHEVDSNAPVVFRKIAAA